MLQANLKSTNLRLKTPPLLITAYMMMMIYWSQSIALCHVLAFSFLTRRRGALSAKPGYGHRCQQWLSRNTVEFHTPLTKPQTQDIFRQKKCRRLLILILGVYHGHCHNCNCIFFNFVNYVVCKMCCDLMMIFCGIDFVAIFILILI